MSHWCLALNIFLFFTFTSVWRCFQGLPCPHSSSCCQLFCLQNSATLPPFLWVHLPPTLCFPFAMYV
jgi:hypothetical protein